MDVDLLLVDERCDLLGSLSVNGAAERHASSEYLLHCSFEFYSHGLGSELLCDINNVVHLEVAIVLDVLLLLSVSGAFLKSLDDERSSGGQHCNEALSVLNHHFNLNFDSSPVSGGLLDVFTDLLGGHTEGTALGGESGSTGDFSSYHFEVDYIRGKNLG